MEEEEEICRVCRSEGTLDQPLFHPCKCSGSIRYVHQDCLLEWLEHSNKRYCELCKHSFAFTPIYSPEMPETIPRGMLIGRALERLGKLTCLILRGILVTTIWLVILPYFTIWIWRLYFWIGETFAFRVNGLETPLWNSTMFFSTQPNITVSKPVSAFAPERRISLLIFQGLAPEYQWVSKFILDCFEGQVISSVVVIMFVALFLLREWVLQNQNADRARVAVDDAAAPAVGAEPEAQGFNVEHAVERFIAVQRRIEAVVEGEADLSDEDSDEVSDEELEQIQERTQSPPAVSSAAQQPTTPVEHWNLIDFQNTAEAAREERNSITAEHRPKFFWETGATGGAGSSARPMPLPPTIAPVESGLSALGATSASSGLASCEETGSRSTNERTCPSNLTTEIYTSAPTIDRSGKRPGTLHGRLNQGISYRAPEDMPNLDDMPTATPRVEYVYDSLNQTYHPDTRSVSSPSPPEPASVTYSSNDGQRGSGPNRLWIGQNFLAADNGEGSSGELRQIQGSLKDNIRSQGGSPLYWKAGIPLTYENVYVKEDGSGMSFSEKAARYEELCRTGVLAFADESRLSSLRQDTQTHQASAEQLQQLAQVQQERQDVIHRINERGIRMRLRDNGVAPQPDENPGQAAALPRPPQVRRPAVMAPAAPPPVDDELEEFNVEELDGVLELIGMHGSYWILLQNSLLMSALICASLGVGIWIPFMIGKTILLMNPFNFLRVPFVLLSRLTDPVLDYMFDRMLPYASATASKTAAVLRSNLSPHVILMVESYLGGTALKPFAVMFEDHILPTWHAIMEITATSAPQGVTSKDSLTVVIEAMEPASNATLAVNTVTDSANTPVVHHVVRQWGELAYGTTSGNKLAAIVVGYAVLVAMAFWYFLRTQHSYGHRFSRAARSILCQCGLIVKIIFFVGIEMVVFPLFCGFVIDLSTLPLFKGASAASRIAFYKLSPNWSLIMHWLVGTAFMFNISVFVSLCRSMVRPGVMWFVRDPNDEGFHPIREILERPVILLLRKLGSGVLMYLALILLGVTFTIHSINLMLSGVLPLRWPVDEPISDFPIDMLLFHLVFPMTARWLNPTNRLKIIFSAWWRKLSRWLRLSSFMYASDGLRYYDEEGYVVYRSWKTWFLGWRPPMPGLEDAGTEIAGGGEELDIDAQVIFVRDGGLMRVPASDRIYHLKDRRVLVPVDENGNALDPREDTLGEVDPLTELQARRTDELIDPKDNTIVVYAPPHFQKRLMLFVVLLWLSVTFFLVLSVIIPTVLGRAVLALKTNRAVHDIYSIMVGVYVLRGLWSLLDWISSKWHSFVTHGLQPINVRTQLQTVWGLFRTTAKLAYFGLTFGVIIPFLLGFMMELFVILPIRSSIEAHPIDTGNDASDNDTARAITGETGSIIFVVNWAVGLLYMKMVHRILSVMPNNRFAADMNRVFVGTNVNDWDTALATRRLILPVLGTFALAISLPLALAWIVVECLGLEGIQRLWVFRQTYPLALMISLLIIGLKESVSILRGWSQYVRDQEYLVGRQLHNHQDESIQQQQQQQQQQVQRTATATLQDQGRDTDYGYVPEAPIIPALQKQPSLESHGYEEYLDMARSHDLRRSTSRSPSLTSISFTSTTTGTKDEDYGPPLLRSNSRLIRDPPLASEGDDYENEGDSIAHRTRLRRSRRLQAQQAQDAMFDGK